MFIGFKGNLINLNKVASMVISKGEEGNSLILLFIFNSKHIPNCHFEIAISEAREFADKNDIPTQLRNQMQLALVKK